MALNQGVKDMPEMPIFEVSTIEVKHRLYKVEATTEAEAEAMVRQGAIVPTDDVSEGEKIEITDKIED